MLIKKILYPLSQEEYKKIIILLFLTVLSSFAELISIGLILPILNIFVGNDLNSFSKYIDVFNIDLQNTNKFLVIILIIFGFIHLIKFFLNKTLINLQNNFSHKLYLKISKKLFYDYLNQDFSFYLNKNSADLTRNIITEGNLFSFGVVFHCVRLVSEIIIFLSIGILLLIYSFEVTIITISFFTLVGIFFLKLNSSNLRKWGEIRQFHSAKIFKQLQESFDGFRELLLNKLEIIFFNNFSRHALKNAEVGIKKDTTVQMPRLFLELTAITLVISIIIYLLSSGYDFKEIFVILGVFLYATLRILPSVSKIIQSIQSIKFNNAVIDIIYNQLINIKNKNDSVSYNFSKTLDFGSVNFNNIKFWYKDEKKITLDDININIKKGSKIGIVGKSGSGKSTFINLFCGLLKPNRGNIFIDNANLKNVCKEFQEGMAYVPQKVTIFDESILFNITLEVDEDLIDFSKLNKILKITEMYDFVYSLSKNIKENVGEKGSKLSGGQCQRIGIARVLYKEKDIIIFDEATSALDENTEIKIFDKIFEIYKEKTILISSHRRSLLNYCDMIYEIKDKKIYKILNEK